MGCLCATDMGLALPPVLSERLRRGCQAARLPPRLRVRLPRRAKVAE